MPVLASTAGSITPTRQTANQVLVFTTGCSTVSMVLDNWNWHRVLCQTLASKMVIPWLQSYTVTKMQDDNFFWFLLGPSFLHSSVSVVLCMLRLDGQNTITLHARHKPTLPIDEAVTACAARQALHRSWGSLGVSGAHAMRCTLDAGCVYNASA